MPTIVNPDINDDCYNDRLENVENSEIDNKVRIVTDRIKSESEKYTDMKMTRSGRVVNKPKRYEDFV